MLCACSHTCGTCWETPLRMLAASITCVSRAPLPTYTRPRLLPEFPVRRLATVERQDERLLAPQERNSAVARRLPGTERGFGKPGSTSWGAPGAWPWVVAEVPEPWKGTTSWAR